MTIASDRVLSPKSVSGVALPTKPLKLEERGGYLVCADSNRLDYQETVIITGVTITTSAADTLRFTCNDTVRRGQTITYYADRSMRAMKLATIRGNKLSGLYNPATLLFESMAFSEGVIKKTPGTDPTRSPTWFYHYYLRDHLGSTRMVVKDDGTLVEASMYQPYGTMDPIASGTDAVRKRFTGKELDKDGKTVSGAPGMGLVYFGARYYDSDIGGWASCDRAGQFFNPYGYTGNGANPVIMVDEDGNFLFLIAIGIAAVVSGSISAYKVGKAGGTTGQVWAAFGIGALAGAAGAAVGAGVGLAIAPLGSALAGALSPHIGTFASGLVTASLTGAASGAVGGTAGGFIGGFGISAGVYGRNFSESIQSGLSGAGSGAVKGLWMGAASGAVSYSVNCGINALKSSPAGNTATRIGREIQNTRTGTRPGDPNTVGNVTARGLRGAGELQMTHQPMLSQPNSLVMLPRADVASPVTFINLPHTPTAVYNFPEITITSDMINVPLPPGVLPADVLPASGTVPW